MATKIIGPNTAEIFLCGYVKNIMCQEKVTDLRTPRRGITEAVVTVTEMLFVNTWRAIEYIFDLCRAANCAHIKTY
jgi:hypothetical protein